MSATALGLVSRAPATPPQLSTAPPVSSMGTSSGTRRARRAARLPVYEPQRLGGQLNRNAVHAAANRLLRERGGVQAPVAVKRAVAQRLLDLYGVIGDPPPRALRLLAGGAPRPISVQVVRVDELDGRSR
jgi:hypothetical protein